MTKRWGTSVKQWTEHPNDQAVEEEDDHSNQEEKEGIFFRKAVVDPWNNKEGSHPSSRSVKKKTKTTTNKDNINSIEFYDEDDEGYETNDDDGYGDIIAPQPVATKTSTTPTATNVSSSVFSRRSGTTIPLAEEKESESVSSKETDSTSSKEITKAVSKKSHQNAAAQPLLDEVTGKPMYLTLDKALEDAAKGVPSTQTTVQEPPPPQEEEATFESLGIRQPELLRNLARLSLHTALPVQSRTIPPALLGRDVLLPTHTGSGKTLAFLLPIVERLLKGLDESNQNQPRGGVRVLILAPGRELASQIMAVARDLIRDTDLRAVLAIGGTPFTRTATAIRKDKPDIVVATPGRLAELVLGRSPEERSGKLKLNALHTIVLDEFDALLQYEPHREPTTAVLNRVHDYVTARRRTLQTFLCSATAKDVDPKVLRGYFWGDADHVTAESEESPITTSSGMSKTVTHGIVHVPHPRLVLETLRKVLHTEPAPEQILIFVENSRRVDVVVDKLAKMNIIAAPLQGGSSTSSSGSSKNDRAEINKALREGYVGLVVATELAARGIDAPFLTHVINLDLPTDASHYAHRAGRCGRGAGKPGVVLNFTSSPPQRKVPQNKFGDLLGIDMYTVEPREGRLLIVNGEKKKKGSSSGDDSRI